MNNFQADKGKAAHRGSYLIGRGESTGGGTNGSEDKKRNAVLGFASALVLALAVLWQHERCGSPVLCSRMGWAWATHDLVEIGRCFWYRLEV